MLGAMRRMCVKVLLTIMDEQCAVLLPMDERLRFATNKNISFCLDSQTNVSTTVSKVTGTQHEDVRGDTSLPTSINF